MSALPAASVRTATPGDVAELRRIAELGLRWDDAPGVDLVGLLWPRSAPRFAVLVEAEGHVVGFALASFSADNARGYVNLIVVAASYRRRGYGRALLEELEGRLAEAGADTLQIGGAMPVYAWPGVDVRYTAACCMAEDSGYAVRTQPVNMTVELAAAQERFATADAEKSLLAKGFTIRRLTPQDRDLISPWLATWHGSWRAEVLSTIGRPEAGCHIAVHEGEYVGFAAYGVNRPDWFGPMGTSESLRGLGIGGVLLHRCLLDIHDAGYDRAQVGWVGPIAFYARTVDAYIERVFKIYSKAL